MRLLIALILLLPAFAQAKDITTIAGEWKCEYAARHLTDRNQTSAMWFQVTLDADGTFSGGGKSNTMGLVAKSELSGGWSWENDTLTLDGKSLGPFGELPFLFAADRRSDGELGREWTRNDIEQSTRCTR